MDQTLIPFYFLDRDTYGVKETVSVKIKATKNNQVKGQAILILTIFANEIWWIQFLLIFKAIQDSKRNRICNEKEQQLQKIELAKYISYMNVKLFTATYKISW